MGCPAAPSNACSARGEFVCLVLHTGAIWAVAMIHRSIAQGGGFL